MRAIPWIVALALASGCAQTRDPAPDDLDGLSRYMFRYFGDDAAMQDAVGKLIPILEDRGTDEGSAGWRLSNLDDLDTLTIEHPDTDLSRMIGVSMTYDSPFPVGLHADVQLDPNQTWLDPATYIAYDRELIEGEGETFRAGDCAIVTDNYIHKKGAFGIEFDWGTMRGFQWVDTPAGRALVGTGGAYEVACSDNGATCMHQSFALEVFYEASPGQTLRYNGIWMDVTTDFDAVVTDDLRVKMALGGLSDVFEQTDVHLHDLTVAAD